MFKIKAHHVFRDAVAVSCINCMTSLFGGFAIFSVIGFMAHTLQKDVSEVVSSGEGCKDFTVMKYAKLLT